MHVRFCECDDCLPGTPAKAAKVRHEPWQTPAGLAFAFVRSVKSTLEHRHGDGFEGKR